MLSNDINEEQKEKVEQSSHRRIDVLSLFLNSSLEKRSFAYSSSFDLRDFPTSSAEVETGCCSDT